MRPSRFLPLLLLSVLPLGAQQTSPAPTGGVPAAGRSGTTLTRGTQLLFGLESKLQQAVKERGGAGYREFMADDVIMAANGQPTKVGKDATSLLNWSPQDVQLTWTPQGGEMDAANDMGFTFGTYERQARSVATGGLNTTKGRYMSIWRKMPDGSWKVAMDMSNQLPAEDCCELPKIQ